MYTDHEQNPVTHSQLIAAFLLFLLFSLDHEQHDQFGVFALGTHATGGGAPHCTLHTQYTRHTSPHSRWRLTTLL